MVMGEIIKLILTKLFLLLHFWTKNLKSL